MIANRTLKLAAMTLVLITASILVYSLDEKRQENIFGKVIMSNILEKNLDKIVINKPNNNEKISFEKNVDRYLIVEKNYYQADSKKIEQLIQRFTKILYEKKYEGSEKLYEELGLSEDRYNEMITFYNADGSIMTQFYTGIGHNKKGAYLRKDKDIYYVKGDWSLEIDANKYVDKKIISLDRDDVDEISIESGMGREIAYSKQQIDDNPRKNKVIEKILKIQHEGFYPVYENRFMRMEFNDSIKIKLRNNLEYILKLCVQEKDVFMKIISTMDEMPTEVSIRKNDGMSKLRRIESLLVARDQSDKFNKAHIKWIYRIEGKIYDSLKKVLEEQEKDEKETTL